jgi:hypothetical protein
MDKGEKGGKGKGWEKGEGLRVGQKGRGLRMGKRVKVMVGGKIRVNDGKRGQG